MDKRLRHKIGQMISAGFPSPEVDEQARTLAEKYEVGNFYVFGRNLVNAEQTCALTRGLTRLAYEKNGVAPFITIDQEGGAVSRIVDGCSLFPGAMALAASGTDQAYQVGKNCAEVLRAMGITATSSPVLDVNVEPLNPIIGARAFGDDPEQVASLGVAMMKGLMDGGLIANVKHYPGHGNVKSDSHLELPVNDTKREILEKTEWAPFQAAFDAGADALMTAHVVYKDVDPVWPATISKTIMTDLLRNKQNFKGVAVTDCMEMDAVRKTYGCGKAAVLAIEAGCDILTVSHTLEAVDQIVTAIYEAVESGRITEERIDQSYNRIMALKKKYGLLEMQEIDVARARSIADDPERNALHKKISRNSISILSGSGTAAILKNAKKPLFLAPPSFALNGAEDPKINPLCFSKKAFEAGAGDSCVLPLNEFSDEVKAALENPEYDAFVLGLYNARFRKGQVETLRALEKSGKPLIIVLLGAPYDVSLVERADAIVAVYEYTVLSVQSAIEAMFEDDFPGKSPVKLL